MDARRRTLIGTAFVVALLAFLGWSFGHAPSSTQPQLASRESEADAGEEATPDHAAVAADETQMEVVSAEVSAEEAALAAVLVPALCTLRDRCGCGAYPPPSASREDRVGATTCEADVTRDLHLWWAAHVTSPVVVLEGEALTAQLENNLGCAGFHGSPMDFLRADAGAGEACGTAPRCRNGSRCQNGICEAASALGEACTDGYARDASNPEIRRRTHEPVPCVEGLACIDHRCALRTRARAACPLGTLQRPLPGDGWDTRPTECIPTGAPCTSNYDCGWGFCEGPSQARRCMAPGPPRDPEVSTPTCREGESCVLCGCPEGTACARSESPPMCRPLAREGEPCEHAICGEGLRCSSYVPEGHCIAQLCRLTHPFGRDLRNPARGRPNGI